MTKAKTAINEKVPFLHMKKASFFAYKGFFLLI